MRCGLRQRNSFFTREISQGFGMSPSQGMPEGLRGTVASRPRVTTRWMMACFCSLSSAISFFFARIARSIRPFAWSRNRTMASCSSRGGTSTGICRIPAMVKSHWPMRTPSDAWPKCATYGLLRSRACPKAWLPIVKSKTKYPGLTIPSHGAMPIEPCHAFILLMTRFPARATL